MERRHLFLDCPGDVRDGLRSVELAIHLFNQIGNLPGGDAVPVEFDDGCIHRITVSLVGSQRLLMKQAFPVPGDQKVQIPILRVQDPAVVAVS